MRKLINTNKKATFEYFIIETYEAGIELVGTEVKAIREKTCQIAESYIQVKNNEMYILNMKVEKSILMNLRLGMLNGLKKMIFNH